MTSLVLRHVDNLANYMFSDKNSDIFNMSMFIFIIITGYKISINKEILNIVKKFLKQKTIVINLLIIVFFCFLVYRFKENNDSDNNNVKKTTDATKKAIIGLLIALFAKVDMIIAPFWFIWILSFSMGNI